MLGRCGVKNSTRGCGDEYERGNPRPYADRHSGHTHRRAAKMRRNREGSESEADADATSVQLRTDPVQGSKHDVLVFRAEEHVRQKRHVDAKPRDETSCDSAVLAARLRRRREMR